MDQSQPVVPAYQLRVALRGVSPLIWRRLLVRSDITLAQLHDILQAAFTWSDYHLHRFRIQGKQYGSEGGDPRRVRLTDFRLHPGERFSYFYNFIDDWECEVRLEEVRPLEQDKSLMREFRSWGSVRGAAGNRCPYRDPFRASPS